MGTRPAFGIPALRADVTDAGARAQLERALGLHDMTHPRNGLAAMTGDDLAGFVHAPARGDVVSAVGIGPPRLLEGLAESFALATRALSTARAFALVGVRSVETLGLLPAVVGDGAVGDALCRRYLEPLTQSAAEIMASLRAYFDCDMRVERAAERLRPPEHAALPHRAFRRPHRRQSPRPHNYVRGLVGAATRSNRQGSPRPAREPGRFGVDSSRRVVKNAYRLSSPVPGAADPGVADPGVAVRFQTAPRAHGPGLG